jgi:hypothetical protein
VRREHPSDRQHECVRKKPNAKLKKNRNKNRRDKQKNKKNKRGWREKRRS